MRQIGRDPIFIERGEGCRADRRRRQPLRRLGLLLGAADPRPRRPRRASRRSPSAAARGTSFGAATEAEVELAEEVVARVPSVEMIRMTSSGTEAAMSAVRLARAATGREVAGQVRRRLPRPRRRPARRGRLRPRDPRRSRRAPASPPPRPPAPWSSPGTTAQAVDRRARPSTRSPPLLVEPVAANMGVVPPADGFLEFLPRADARAPARCSSSTR